MNNSILTTVQIVFSVSDMAQYLSNLFNYICMILTSLTSAKCHPLSLGYVNMHCCRRSLAFIVGSHEIPSFVVVFYEVIEQDQTLQQAINTCPNSTY